MVLAGTILCCGTRLLGQTTQPLVAIHDSEYTRALESIPASGSTPAGEGYSSNEWWPTNWHYFVMPESLREGLRSDGTAHTIIGDSNILAGELLVGGVPRYPIVISLAAEAVHDDEVAALTNYVAAGGVLFVGSSSFTRHTNGTTRGDFAIAQAMGVHCALPELTNWVENTVFVKEDEHRIVRHIPDGTLTWRMPAAAEEINFGVSPSHTYLNSHWIWRVVATNATVLAQGNASPYLTVKPYGRGWFIYYAPMQPLIGHGGWAPTMYAYGIFRNAIDWAFEAARLPVPRLSPWPYGYDAAFMIRHDLENYKDEIAAIESSAQFEKGYGGRGDYNFCTGSLRVELGNSPTVIAALRRAVTNYQATIAAHNGGLPNPGNPSLIVSDYDYWHWGPDEVLDLTPTNYLNGKHYALVSLSNSFVDVDTWLSGIDTGPRLSAACYFNATREDSFDIQDQLGVKISGDQKSGPFPHWTLSTATSGKRYPMLSEPLSDWFVGSQTLQVGQSLEYHDTATIRAGIDYFYSLGGLINFYSHTLSTGQGSAGSVATEYVTYGLDTNRFPRMWSANAISVYEWWLQRSTVRVSVEHTATNGNISETTFSVLGATSPATAVELQLPATGQIEDLQVFTNGTVASPGAWRSNQHGLKILVGNSVTNVQVRYALSPLARDDYYWVMTGQSLSVPSEGVLLNDETGLSGTNLTAQLIDNPGNGTVFLADNGGFTYTPDSNYLGTDAFSYAVSDGISNSRPATAFISVVPDGVLFLDDFTRQSGFSNLGPWRVVSGNWTATNGALIGSGTAHNYSGIKVDGNWTNYAVQGTIQFTPGGFGAGFGGRLDPVTGAHYAAWIYPEDSAGGSSVLKLIKFLNWGNWSGTPMAQVSLPGVGTNSHLLRVVFVNNRIRVFYDSVSYIDFTDTGFSGTGAYTAGGITVGLYTYLSSYDCLVDNVSVTMIGSPLLANDDAFSTQPNAQLSVSAPGLVLNDAGGSGPLNAYLIDGPTNGVLTLNSNGSFIYTPATDYVGADAFIYQITDGITNSPSATTTINVLPSNAPLALSPFSDRMLHAGDVLRVSSFVTAGQSNALTFTLLAAPERAEIDATNGLIVWPSTVADLNTTNLFTVQVTDDGAPPLSDTKSFVATVVSLPTITSIALSNEVVWLTWTAISNQAYRLQYTDQFAATNWNTSAYEILAQDSTASTTNAIDGQSARFYRVLVSP
ncbi:MAG TPA: Ig-like domain-containing protein [Verrucomicrobiae bacterium]|nr:Ig-like domain-containing protein [Verrucomicrobiae bacterium]